MGGGGRGDRGARGPRVATLGIGGGVLGAEAEEALGLPGGKAGGTAIAVRGATGLVGGEGTMRGGVGGTGL